MRRASWVLIVLLAMGLGTSSTFAAKPQPLWSGALIADQLDRSVDPWTQGGIPVVNPTDCLWDFDDHLPLVGNSGGYLDPGQLATVTMCFIASPNPVHLTVNGHEGDWSWAIHPRFRVTVTADHPVEVTTCYPTQGICFDGSDLCTSGPFYEPDDDSVALIEGSGGGYGVVSSVTWTVTNPGSKRVRDVVRSVVGGNDQDQCRGVPMTSVVGDGWTMWVQEPA